MKGYRFYLEYDSPKHKRNHQSTDNVLAVLIDDQGYPLQASNHDIECVGALYSHADSTVASTSVSQDYLTRQCHRISEREARKIHPNLFIYLEGNDA
jgi:hypothetical protein